MTMIAILKGFLNLKELSSVSKWKVLLLKWVTSEYKKKIQKVLKSILPMLEKTPPTTR